MPIAALIQGATNLAGTIYSGYTQRKMNKEQLKLARETNAQNYKMWQEQQQHNIDMYNMQSEDAWDMANYQNQYNHTMYERQKRDNIDMWNIQNAYNTPEAQKQRLLAAGINPYLAMSGNAGTAAGSVQGATPQGAASLTPPSMQSSSPIPAQMPHSSAFTNSAVVGIEAGKAVGDIINGIVQSQETVERIKGMKIDNKYKEQIIKDNMSFVQQQTRNLALASDLQEATMTFEIDKVRHEAEEQKAKAMLARLNAEQQAIINKYVDQNQQIDLMTKARAYVNLGLQGELTKAQVKTEIAKQVDYYASASLKKSQKEGQDQQNRILKVDADQKEWSAMSKEQAQQLGQAVYDAALSEAVNNYLNTEVDNVEQRQWLNHPNWNKGMNVLDRIARTLSPIKLSPK